VISRNRPTKALAIGLAALAGYVDAIAYLETGGFFVSFMSGNTTRLGVGLADGSKATLIALGLVGCFVIGVAAATFAGYTFHRARRTAILCIVSLMLATAAVLAAIDAKSLAVACLAFAMGAENAVLGDEGETSVALTYMTGTLVKLGRCLAARLRGGDTTGWASNLMLWTGLLFGATIGALTDAKIGTPALWIGAGAAACLALGTRPSAR
jgi:uncharacterized membrane protein YoaK (UPF0700 family)